jgi:proline dehydrogenase
MLRSLLLYLSRAGWARRFISRFRFARLTAMRFVAGERIEDAIAAIRALNARGINATLDHLGESVTNEAEAIRAAEDYVRALDKIAESGVRANISIKLTQLGLDLGQEFCLGNVRCLAEKAQMTGNFVRIDMEGAPHLERTLALFRTLRQEFQNVGLVVQSYLYRTEADVRALTEGSHPARLRLCKGAYNEPPELAFPRKADVDANFVKLTRLLFERARTLPPEQAAAPGQGRLPPLPAIATHDEKMIAAAQACTAELGLPRDRFEFQMLYGIRRERQEQLAAEGYAVRVYVPYGTQWYPYFMRRLAERPANVWFFLSNLFKR